MGGNTVHRLPNKPPAKWMQTLMHSFKYSKGKTIVGSILGTCAISAAFWGYFMSTGN
jgi:hypothetical protein